MVSMTQTPVYPLRFPGVDRGSSASPLVGWLAVVLYVASFFFDATDGVPGYAAFFYSLFFPVFWPAWLANLFFWIGLARLSGGRNRSAGVTALMALFLALSAVLICGNKVGAGFLLWSGSMAVLTTVGLARERKRWPSRRLIGEATRITSRFTARRISPGRTSSKRVRGGASPIGD